MTMCLRENRTAELWRSFMPRRHEIKYRSGNHFISMQVYQPETNIFDAATLFEKWAAVEISDADALPEGMECYRLRGGLYAVFNYQGTPEGFYQAEQYIYGSWLPASGYVLDEREHFERLPENYHPQDPDAEEEIWIPVRPS